MQVSALREQIVQIPQILAERGYVVKERGVISVKGKGEMLTFYVIGRKISRSGRFGKTLNQGNNSLAEVVYGMVRARKRRTARRGKGKTLLVFSWPKFLPSIIPTFPMLFPTRNCVECNY